MFPKSVHVCFDNVDLQGKIQDGIESVIITDCYTHPLLPGVFPSTVRELFLPTRYNHPLLPGTIPPLIVRVALPALFNQPLLPGVFPEGIKEIYFGDRFNQPLLPGVIPSSVRRLSLPGKYEHDLLFLPNELKELRISISFEKEIVFPLMLENFVLMMAGIVVKEEESPLFLKFKRDSRLHLFKEMSLIEDIISHGVGDAAFFLREIVLEDTLRRFREVSSSSRK